MTPLVSVILPTHDRPRTLGRAIQSVLAQLHDHLELVVVDDASKPDTSEVVRAFDDSRLRYVRMDRNRGAAAARNAGIREARGELIAFQDDDDIWLIDKLEKQVTYLTNRPDIGLCLCGYFRVNPGGATVIGMDTHENGRLDFSRGPFDGFGVIATPGWLVRRSILNAAGGFDERLKSWDDWEMGCRIAKTSSIGYHDEPLFIQDRIQGGQMWRNRSVYASDMAVILEKHSDVWRDKPRLLSRQYTVMGRAEAAFHSTSRARRALLRAIRLDPLAWKTWLALAGTLAGPSGYRFLERTWQSTLSGVSSRPIR